MIETYDFAVIGMPLVQDGLPSIQRHRLIRQIIPQEQMAK